MNRTTVLHKVEHQPPTGTCIYCHERHKVLNMGPVAIALCPTSQQRILRRRNPSFEPIGWMSERGVG